MSEFDIERTEHGNLRITGRFGDRSFGFTARRDRHLGSRETLRSLIGNRIPEAPRHIRDLIMGETLKEARG